MNVKRYFDQAPSLFWCGITGIALAAICSAVAAIYGIRIPPEGDLTKAITFDLALGIYILTVALVVPLAEFTPAGRRRWVRLFLVMNLYAYAVETIQTLRGLDPRFSRVAGPADQVIGFSFGIAALILATTFVILAVRIWRQPLQGPNRLVLLALRYGSIVTVLGFLTGFWMGGLQGRHVGEAGNILPLHAMCFHALQAIPLVALLFKRSKLPDSIARPWIHVSGLTWLGVCLAIAWQTAAGRPVTQFSPAMLTAVLLGLAWLISLAKGMVLFTEFRGQRAN